MALRLTVDQARRLGVKPEQLRTPVGRSALKTRPALRPHSLTPQEILTVALTAAVPGAVAEFEGAVPGRRFRIDVAFPMVRVAVEVDGYAFHGKHLRDFKRDREKRNALALLGWVVLAYPAGRIRKDLEGIVGEIAGAVACIQSRAIEPMNPHQNARERGTEG